MAKRWAGDLSRAEKAELSEFLRKVEIFKDLVSSSVSSHSAPLES
jgi:hypothetical protein